MATTTTRRTSTGRAHARVGITGTALLLGCLAAVAGCKHKSEPASGGAGGGSGGSTEPPTLPVGTATPVATLSSDGLKQLDRGYKALRAKQYVDAVAAFRAVTTAAPDYVAARWPLIRALALAGQFDAVPAEYEALIARDYVGYAARLDKGKELAPLRAAPAWARIGELRARYRGKYAAGFDRGFFLVVRTRAAVEPAFNGGATEAALDLRQEAFHYDPESQRFRRVTDTDGHVFAINRSPDGKQLAFVVAPRLHREGGSDAFVDPKLGVLDLAALEIVGPFAQKGRYEQVGLGTNRAGQPMFTLVAGGGAAAGGNSNAFTFDTAHSGLAKLSGDGVLPAGGETRAWPNQVAHFEDKAVPGVTIEDGATQFTVEGVPAPVVAARPIAQSSLAWSPSKTRLTYAGKLDACQILQGKSKDKNELYVYDKLKRSAQRIAAAVSPFESLWLDDDRLVYEGGVGKAGQIHIYALGAHADSALPTRHGAGLYGVPTLACEQAEAGIDQEVADDEAEGD